MDNNNAFTITNRDIVLRAWENSTELVRDFENYSRHTKNNKEVSSLFAKFAEDEAVHASKLLGILNEYEKK